MANCEHLPPSDFTGERMTAGIVENNPEALGKAVGDYLRSSPAHFLTRLGALLIVKEQHLERYRFVAETGELFGKRVLDLACGEGYGCKILDGGFPSLVVGADIDNSALQQAQQEYGNAASWVVSDGEELPFAADTFDVISCFETVEHAEDDRKLLAEFQRVLDGDGTLFISTPNRDVSNPKTSIGAQPANQFHMREYTVQEFRELLGDYFEEVELYGQDLNGLWRQAHPLKRKIIGLIKLLTIKTTTEVKPLKETDQPAYLVAVCRGKKVKEGIS